MRGKAETGVTQSQAQELQEFPTATKIQGRGVFSLIASRRIQLYQQLDFRLLASNSLR